MSFFIGFKNNQAYDRWWEARKIWGRLLSHSRNWARELTSFTTNKEHDLLITSLIKRHITFFYRLKQSLRKRNIELGNNSISEDEMKLLNDYSNQAVALLKMQSKDLNKLYPKNEIDGFQFIELNKNITNFMDEVGKSERIALTVFPTTYNSYTRLFIYLFIITSTLVLADFIGVFYI